MGSVCVEAAAATVESSASGGIFALNSDSNLIHSDL